MGMMDKAKQFLSSDSGKQKSREVLDKAEQAGTDRFGEQHSENIGKARDFAEERLGLKEEPAREKQTTSEQRDEATDPQRPDAPGAAGGEGHPRS